jgi:hypothetical protein
VVAMAVGAAGGISRCNSRAGALRFDLFPDGFRRIGCRSGQFTRQNTRKTQA